MASLGYQYRFNQVAAITSTLPAATDDGIPVTYPQRAWLPARGRLPDQAQALDWETLHAVTGDGLEAFTPVMRARSTAYARLPVQAADLHVEAAAPAEDEAPFARYPLPRRAIVRRAVPPYFDPETLHATMDDGVPLALHQRSRRVPRRWSAQIVARDWSTEHSTEDDGLGRPQAGRMRRPSRARLPEWMAPDLEVVTGPADDAPVTYPARGRRPPRGRLPAQPQALDWRTEHATTDDGTPVWLRARARARRRAVVIPPVTDSEQPAAAVADDGLAHGLRVPRARRALRGRPPAQVALDWRTEHATTDDGVPATLRPRAFRLRRVVFLGQVADIEQPTEAPADDGSAFGLSVPRARRRQRTWLPRQIAIDWSTEHATTDDGVPVALHQRSRRIPRRWSAQRYDLDWRTEQALDDDATPVALHMRSRRIPRRWSAQIAAREWETLQATTDDGVPVALHGRSRRVPRRWAARSPQWLDWATLHATDDDGVPLGQTRPWRRARPYKRLPGLVHDLEAGLAGLVDEAIPSAPGPLVSRWAIRRAASALASWVAETLDVAADDDAPIALHGRVRQARRRAWAPRPELDWRTEDAPEGDGVPVALHGRMRRTPWRVRLTIYAADGNVLGQRVVALLAAYDPAIGLLASREASVAGLASLDASVSGVASIETTIATLGAYEVAVRLLADAQEV